jgi:hypothetical protein
VLVL